MPFVLLTLERLVFLIKLVKILLVQSYDDVTLECNSGLLLLFLYLAVKIFVTTTGFHFYLRMNI